MGAVDAKHLDLWTGPEDSRMLHFPPGSLLSSTCSADVGEGRTWPGPAHFLRGASARLPADRMDVRGRREKQSLCRLFWGFLGSGTTLCPPSDTESPVATARQGVLASHGSSAVDSEEITGGFTLTLGRGSKAS